MADKPITHRIRGDLLTLAAGIVVDRIVIAGLHAFVESQSEAERAFWAKHHENLWDLGQLAPVYDSGLALWMLATEYRTSIPVDGWTGKSSRVGRVLREFRPDEEDTLAHATQELVVASIERVKNLKFW